MAERLGLDPPVVSDARARLDDKDAQAEALLKQLGVEQALLRRDQARLAAEQRELHDERVRSATSSRRWRRAGAARSRASGRSWRAGSDQLARQAADAIHAGGAEGRDRDAADRPQAVDRRQQGTQRGGGGHPRRARRGARTRGARPRGRAGRWPRPTAAPLAVGSRVRVESLGVTGQVMTLSGTDAEVAVGGKRLRVPQAELTAIARRPPPGRRRSKGPARGSRPVPAEINLVGLTVDEALPRVDKLLDDAALSDRRELRVIHGFGAGRLPQGGGAVPRRPPRTWRRSSSARKAGAA
jgi:DNA mismatch repair protein MutS2